MIWSSLDEGSLCPCLAWTGSGPYDGRSRAGSAGCVQHPGYASGCDNHAPAQHSWYEGVRNILCHLGHTGAEALHLLLEIPLRRRFLYGGIPIGGVALGIEAGLARHSRVWGL
ncbi:unnamed protein product, partial [Prunus brigantina]